MRIGIDIDDTIVNTSEMCINYVKKLDKKYGENIKDIITDNIKNPVVTLFYDNYLYDVIAHAKLKEDAVKVINELYRDNEIYFITARETLFYNYPYGLSKEYLTKNNIYFDKLITDAKNKEKICEEYNVDILIDDRYTTIEKVINNGKKAIIFDTNWNRNYNKSPRAHNWQEVYNYIKSLEDNNE